MREMVVSVQYILVAAIHRKAIKEELGQVHLDKCHLVFVELETFYEGVL